jgi:hypothetical protein
MMRINTKRAKILNFIRNSEDGRTYSEIQKFVCDMNGLDWDATCLRSRWDAKNQKKVMYLDRANRGYYGTNLWGRKKYPGDQEGLMHKLCVKINGKWMLKQSVRVSFACDISRCESQERFLYAREFWETDSV